MIFDIDTHENQKYFKFVECNFSVYFNWMCKTNIICSTGEQVTNAVSCPVCGDGQCTGLESSCNCPSDCFAEPDGRRTIPKSCPNEFPLYDSQIGGCTNGKCRVHYEWNNK